MLKLLKTFKGQCDTCECEGNIELIKSYQCLRLFFMPIFKWQVKYFLKHSCGGQIEISEEIAVGILHGTIQTEKFHMTHEAFNNLQCKYCGHVLERDFEYCPYCGKQRN